MGLTTVLMVLGMLAFLPALFCAAAAFDVARGHPRGREFFASLGMLQRRLAADDAPLWAEALGAILGLGLTLRSTCHLLAAVIGRHGLELVDNDVGLGSSVASLRSEPAADCCGRVFSVLLGSALYLALHPPTVVVPGPEMATGGVQVWLMANIIVLVSDPLQMLTHMTQTHIDRPTRGEA